MNRASFSTKSFVWRNPAISVMAIQHLLYEAPGPIRSLCRYSSFKFNEKSVVSSKHRLAASK